MHRQAVRRRPTSIAIAQTARLAKLRLRDWRMDPVDVEAVLIASALWTIALALVWYGATA